MTAAVRIGIIGAGPWARGVLGPAFAAGPETAVPGVWSRTPESRAAFAAELGVAAYDSVDRLLAACDAVAIAVPPAVQPDLAERAAAAGRPMLLEKPLADDLDRARGLHATLRAHDARVIVTLTYRFHPAFTAFRDAARASGALGGRGCFLSGAMLEGSPYAQGWRVERGCVLDLGPHMFDLLEAGLGPIVDVDAHGDRHGWVALTCAHASGATSQASLFMRAAMPSRTEVEVFGPNGTVAFDGRGDGAREAIAANLRRSVAAMARDEAPPVRVAGIDDALHLQDLVARAEARLARGGPRSDRPTPTQ